MAMRIRPARPEDAQVLARLHVDSWRAAYRGLVPDSRLDRLNPGRRAEQFREMLGGSEAETYVGEASGEIVGFLTVGDCRDEGLDKTVTGEIWGIYLAPAHWRKGFGRRLCGHGEGIVRSAGRSVCVLWVFAGNAAARRFYEAMGYAADGASKILEIDAPLEAVRYRKTL